MLVTKCPGLLRQPKFKSNNTYPTQTEKQKKKKDKKAGYNRRIQKTEKPKKKDRS